MSSAPRLMSKLMSGITPEQACDARARAWAYVFSCWQAKQKDIHPEAAGDLPSDNAAKEVSHVELSTEDASNIVYHPLSKEKE